MRNDDDGFQWGNTGEYDFSDLAEFDFEEAERSGVVGFDRGARPDVTSGAGRELYRENARDRRRFARRGSSYDRRLPVWLYAGLGVLVILFVILGIFLGHHAGSHNNASNNEVLQQQAAEQVASMTTEQKVAQLIFTCPYYLTGVGDATEAGDATAEALATYPVGGVFFDSSNITDPDQFSRMVAGYQRASSYPLFCAVAEDDSGRSLLLGADASSPAALAASGKSSDAYAAGLAIGGTLSDYGVNVNFIPFAAVVDDETSPFYYGAYGREAGDVANMVSRTITGMEGQGVSAVTRFFPGTGVSVEDQLSSLIICDTSWDDLLANDVVPFISAVESGSDFIQMSNIAYSQVSGSTPATLSSTMVTDHLRNGLGYQGVIISGCLDAPSITASMTPADAAVAAIQAGCDMVFLSGDVASTYDALLSAVRDGRITTEQLDAACTRIIALKIANNL